MASVGKSGTQRQSPPTARVIAVFEFLARHRGERFGLSELARRVDISKPTCLGIITELVSAGYLIRDSDLRYGLGPALITVGQAAQRGFALGAIAREQLESLHVRFRTVCTASAVVGGRVTVLESVGPRGAQGIGRNYPFAPPVGLMHVVWEPDQVLEGWLDLAPALPVRLDRDHLRRVVAECRGSGHLVESLTPMGQRLQSMMADVEVDQLPAEVREIVGEMVSSLGERVYLSAVLDDGEPHRVSVIAAPVFDRESRQALVMTLYVGEELRGPEIERRASALRAAAESVTREIGGLDPFRSYSR